MTSTQTFACRFLKTCTFLKTFLLASLSTYTLVTVAKVKNRLPKHKFNYIVGQIQLYPYTT